jgi:hypothetical protein
MVMISFHFSLKESGSESDGTIRRIHQEYGKSDGVERTSFSAAGAIDFAARDRVRETVCARLNVIKELEGRSSQ